MGNKLHRSPLFTATEQEGGIYIWSCKYKRSLPQGNRGGGINTCKTITYARARHHYIPNSQLHHRREVLRTTTALRTKHYKTGAATNSTSVADHYCSDHRPLLLCAPSP